MTLGGIARAAGSMVRRAWAYFIDTVEWTSNGARRRPKFSERSDIYDPTAGWGPRDNHPEGLEAERRGEASD